MRLLPSLALAALLGSSLAAFADTFTYTFNASGVLAGTTFTYVDPNGPATFSNSALTPTTSDIVYLGNNFGPATGVYFSSNGTSDAISLGNNKIVTGVHNISYSLTTPGTQTVTDPQDIDYSGTLTITDTPSIVPTPEPSSLILVGSGAVAVAGAVRRRIRTV